MKHEYLECRCTEFDHAVRIGYEELTEWPEPSFFIEVHLNKKLNVFKRLWVALKYVFGYKSKYGAFTETELNREEVEKLHNICSRSLDIT